MTLPGEAAATFSATLVDEWARAGIERAVVCPGSRSAPLALALLRDERFKVDVRLDERAAGFFALGVARVTNRPCIVLTTSGTGAAELHAAVLEAHLSCVPLIACTADRPPELQGVGAPQTIDQQHLFGSAVRLFLDCGVPQPEMRSSWRSMASRAVADATSGPMGPGPVHLNLPFREPLVAEPSELPPPRPGGRPWHLATTASLLAEEDLDRVAAIIRVAERGLIVAGGGASRAEARLVVTLAGRLGWPVLTDPRARIGTPAPAGDRGGDASAVIVGASDSLLRSEPFAASIQPDVVLRFGEPPASRVVGEFLDRSSERSDHVLVDPYWSWRDPGRTSALLLSASPAAVLSGLLERLTKSEAGLDWQERWRKAEEAAQLAIDDVLAAHEEATEPAVARRLYACIPGDSVLMASSSMPVRDLEWFGRPREEPPEVLSNRGANGIDGVVSTLFGAAAASGRPTFGLVGDLALLHDASSLLRGQSDDPGGPVPRCVVVDNGGGGIFSFLPQASLVDRATFERLFGTPQDTRPAELIRGCGHKCVELDSLEGFEEMVVGGAGFFVVRTDRAANVRVHAEIDAAVKQALS